MSYDLSQLSSLDFEELCRDLLQQEEGIRYEIFKPGKDQGIDARYLNGKTCTIVQCKHYLQSGFNKLLNVLSSDELKKIQKLSPSRYVVMTSVPLSASNKKDIQDALSPYIQSQSDIFGQEDLNNLLGLHPQIEEKHFKLWLTSTNVLNRIFHNAIITQSEQLVERIRRKISIYVQNESFQRAIDILGQHHFVIISGEPGVGKTTLAEMLLLKYIEKDFRPFEVRDVKEAYDIYKPEQNFIFYCDDFLGLTYFGDNLYNHEKIESIVNLIELVKRSKSARLILTSREYIIAQASINHERFSSSDFLDAKYQLQLSEYNQLDKARILYNHLYFSDLDDSYVKEIVVNKTYKLIVSHANYMPRIISSLTQSSRLKNVAESEYPSLFLEVLKNPKDLWLHPFMQITSSGRGVLLILLSLGANSQSSHLEKASNAFLDLSAAKNNLPRSYDDYYQAIDELLGSFLEAVQDRIRFHNPSLKDFLEDYLLQRPTLVKHIIESSICWQQILEIRKLTQKSILGAKEYPINIFVDAILSVSSVSEIGQIGRPTSEVLAEIKFLLDMELIANNTELRSYTLDKLKHLCKEPLAFWVDGFVEIAHWAKRNVQFLDPYFVEEILSEINKAVDEHVKDGYMITLEDLSSLSLIVDDDFFPSINTDFLRSVFQEGIESDYFCDEIRHTEYLDPEGIKENIKNLERLTGVDADNFLDWLDEQFGASNEQGGHPDSWDLYKASREEVDDDEEAPEPKKDVGTTIDTMFNDLMDR